MRASRLVTLLFVLQRRRAATAAELAAELDVSERTIYRDVAALTDAGVPLWTEPGPAGGIRLVEGWRTRLDGLTAPEAAALLGASAPQVRDDLGLGSALAGAQAKLLATLPPALRAHAATVAERVHVDAPGWFHVRREVAALPVVAEAVWSRAELRIAYRRGGGAGAVEVERTVRPLGLVLKAGVWYTAAEVVDAGVRTYRMDRIVRAEPTGDTFTRPDGFDLAAHWAEAARRFEGTMLRGTARVRLTRSGMRRLSLVTDAEAAQRALLDAEPDADGWCTVTLETENDEVAAGQLFALGPDAEVLEPDAVRAGVADLARRTAARYRH